MQINDLLKCTGTACVVPDQNNRILIKKYFPFLRITVFLPQAIHNSSRYFVRSVFFVSGKYIHFPFHRGIDKWYP